MKKKKIELALKVETPKDAIPFELVAPGTNYKKFTFQFMVFARGAKTLKYIDVPARSEKEAWELIESKKPRDEEYIYSGFFAISDL